MNKFWYIAFAMVCIVLAVAVGRYMGKRGVGVQAPWNSKANAARAAAHARYEQDQLAKPPTLVIAEQSDSQQDVRDLHKLARVNRFVLPFLLDSAPANKEHELLQRLSTIDVEPVTFQNYEIAALVSATDEACRSSKNREFDADITLLNQALEKARNSGTGVTLF